MINKGNIHQYPALIADNWEDYELIDSGDGIKFERFGPYKFIRPDSQAYWKPKNSTKNWKADAIFSGKDGEEMGRWNFINKVPEKWPMNWQGLKFYARCTPFRHLGLFPEQSVHWAWCQEKITDFVEKKKHPPKILNLFGYTGLASLACAKAGANVTHIDASKKAVNFARENQELAGLKDASIRWIVEDAIKFVEREARRGNKYEGIILDPPKHGRGPNGEVFKLEENMFELLQACAQLLSEDAIFMVATVYAVRLSYLALENTFKDAINKSNGIIEAGEMALWNKTQNRPLPTAIYTRWGA